MANSGDRDPSREHKTTSGTSPPTARSWLEEGNPFVAFRRYADERISSMFQSVIGLPSMVSSFPNGWLKFTDGPQSGTGSRESASAAPEPTESSCREHTSKSWEPDLDDFDRWRLRSEYWHNRPFESTGSESFFDPPWLEGRFPPPFTPFQPLSPFILDACNSEDFNAWPISYILFSPYSPLHLEQPRLRTSDKRGVLVSLISSLNPNFEMDRREPQWRDAFEDLLRFESGKPMLDRNSCDGREEDGDNWLQGLIQRGSLDDNWKLVSGPKDTSPCSIAFKRNERGLVGPKSTWPPTDICEGCQEDSRLPEATTELDLYDRFLQDIANLHDRQYSRAFSDSPLMNILFEERRRRLHGLGEYPHKCIDSQREMQNKGRERLLVLVADKPAVHTGRETVSSKSIASVSQTDPSTSTTSKPSVISTVVTIERTTLSDGLVGTRIGKTKRFADGYEESKEMVTYPEHSKQASDNSEVTSGKDGNRSKSGWFWRH